MLSTSKMVPVALMLGMLVGGWLGYRAAPKAQIERQERVVEKAVERKAEVVEVIRTVKEPSGRVETIVERKKTSQDRSQEVVKIRAESLQPVSPLPSYRVQMGLNIRGQIQSIEAAMRVGGPVWIGGQLQRTSSQPSLFSRPDILLTVGVEF